MSELTPITRKETFLAKVGGQNVVTPTPITREETFLQAIIDTGSGGGGGTGGGVLVANISVGESTVTLDKTWQQIHDSLLVGVVTGVVISEEDMEVSSVFVNNCAYDTETSKYLVNFYGEGFPQFTADSPNDYPSANFGTGDGNGGGESEPVA